MSYNAHGIRLEFVIYFVHQPREAECGTRRIRESSRNAKFLVKGRRGGSGVGLRATAKGEEKVGRK